MLGFKKNNTGTDCDAIAREIAERCASATLSQLSPAATQMSLAQLRGYVRAHAWPQVWAEAQFAAAKAPLSTVKATELAGIALEQTVHLVTRVYLSAPTIAMPAPHIGRWAA